MGGMGKTTIARAVFETIRSRFEVTCFLADVRERCAKKDVTHMQKQLLDQMNISSTGVYSEYDGRTIIQNSLRLKKVLLVLDDVNHEKQLENLAGEQDWFGAGSRIIITTRDIHLLKEHEVQETYNVEGLVENEAFNLFCLKAFKLSKPSEGFLDLSKEMVKYSCGLPLALKVLGSHLYGRSIKVWRSAIEKIKKSSHSEITDVLKISYDGLSSKEKDIFLDITCFFKGNEKDDVTKILEGCGHDAEIGIDILINRSLVTLGQNMFGEVTVGMHDLLEELGKLIVIQESSNNVSKRSRLWCCEDVDFVLTQKKETEATHGIVLHDCKEQFEVRWRDLAFSNICQLKLLILNFVNAPILNNIPSSVRVLHWRGCPMETPPFTAQHYELVDIDLSSSNIVQLGDGKKLFEKLKYLNLSWCSNKQTPDLSGIPNLETLDLKCCDKLNDIHPSLLHHKGLVILNLQSCVSLETLGDKMEMSSLMELDLSMCKSLIKLPEFGKCMKQLSILSLGETGIEELPMSLGNLVGLSELDISGYGKLRSFPNIVGVLCSLSSLTSLSSLKLWGCIPKSSEESTLYYNLGRLSSLTYLDLSSNQFVRVPMIIHELPRLTRLRLYICHYLEVLPELPSSLRELDASCCGSLNASYVNDVIPKMCRVFLESARKDDEDILQVLIPREQIPAWFDYQEQGSSVSNYQSHSHTFN